MFSTHHRLEPIEACTQGLFRGVVPLLRWTKLGSEEDIAAGDPRLRDSLPDCRFVAVHGGCVEGSSAQSKGIAHNRLDQVPFELESAHDDTGQHEGPTGPGRPPLCPCARASGHTANGHS